MLHCLGLSTRISLIDTHRRHCSVINAKTGRCSPVTCIVHGIKFTCAGTITPAKITGCSRCQHRDSSYRLRTTGYCFVLLWHLQGVDYYWGVIQSYHVCVCMYAPVYCHIILLWGFPEFTMLCLALDLQLVDLQIRQGRIGRPFPICTHQVFSRARESCFKN